VRSIDGPGGSFGGGGAGFRSLFPSIVFLLLAFPNIPGFRIGSQDDDQIVAITDSLLLRLKHRFVPQLFPSRSRRKKGARWQGKLRDTGYQRSLSLALEELLGISPLNTDCP